MSRSGIRRRSEFMTGFRAEDTCAQMAPLLLCLRGMSQKFQATTKDLALLVAVMVALCALAARGESVTRSQGISIGPEGVNILNGPSIRNNNGVLSTQFSIFGNNNSSGETIGGYTTVVPKGTSINPSSLTDSNVFFKPYPKEPTERPRRPRTERPRAE